MNSATFRRPLRRERLLRVPTVFRTAALGRRRHTATCAAWYSCRSHHHARPGRAANRSRDPLGRRKSAEMRARGKDQRSRVLPSLRARGTAQQNTAVWLRAAARGRSEEETSKRRGFLLALHLPGSRRASGAAPHGGRVVADTKCLSKRAMRHQAFTCVGTGRSHRLRKTTAAMLDVANGGPGER